MDKRTKLHKAANSAARKIGKSVGGEGVLLGVASRPETPLVDVVTIVLRIARPAEQQILGDSRQLQLRLPFGEPPTSMRKD